MQGSMLREFARVFERKVWRVQVAYLHNAALSSPSVFNQRFDSRLPCANSKPVLNLSKAVFFLIYSSLAVDGGEIKESCGCEQRFLSSLTKKKEQGTSVSQGRLFKTKQLHWLQEMKDKKATVWQIWQLNGGISKWTWWKGNIILGRAILVWNHACEFKSNSRSALVRFWNHACDFRPSCSPLSSLKDLNLGWFPRPLVKGCEDTQWATKVLRQFVILEYLGKFWQYYPLPPSQCWISCL